MNFINMESKFAIPLMIVNYQVILVGLMHWDADSFDNMGYSIYYIRQTPTKTVIFMSFFIGLSMLLHVMVKSLIYKKLLGLLDQYKLQVETH